MKKAKIIAAVAIVLSAAVLMAAAREMRCLRCLLNPIRKQRKSFP